MCSINQYTVVSLEMQFNDWFCFFIHYDEMFCKRFISNEEFECRCCCGFFLLTFWHLFFKNLEDRQFWSRLWAFVVWHFLIHSQRWPWHELQNEKGHLLLSHFRNPEGRRTSPFVVWGLKFKTEACKVQPSFHLWQALLRYVALILRGGILSSPTLWAVDSLSVARVSGWVIEERYWFSPSVVFLNPFIVDLDFWG